MGTVVGVTLIKKFTYRLNSDEEWSNKYFFSGSVPADAAAWKALVDALIVQEVPLYAATCKVVRAYGYDSDDSSPSSVFSYDYTAHSAEVAGTLVATAGVPMAGDQAAVIEWKTSRLNSKGKLIYLRKYVHGGFVNSTNADNISTLMKAHLDTFGTKMLDGSFIDGRTLRSRLNAETLTERVSSPYVTTRTLKRRGRRP